MEEKSMKKSFSSLGFRFLIGTLVIYAVQMGVMTIVGAVKRCVEETAATSGRSADQNLRTGYEICRPDLQKYGTYRQALRRNRPK